MQTQVKLSSNVSISHYTDSPFEYRRRPSREVMAGSVGIGGNNPIRIQSMTVAATTDTVQTVSECKALFDAGCEIVRITAQGPKEARALEQIRQELNRDGYTGPLVADIHFSPRAAMIAVEHVEKVRINPGNFADTKMFQVVEYTDEQYQAELRRIHEVFSPLVLRAKELGRSMRIGVNHGSLSDRIMNRYGDTPDGMVESAIEFIQVAEYYDYKDIIVSMKSSNPGVMIEAYRLLVERFRKENMNYPLHLGVTEAGDGKDGRMKSASGIGALLEDGLGDTIRVSLTEDPVHEIPVAKKLADRYNALQGRTVKSTTEHGQILTTAFQSGRKAQRRKTTVLKNEQLPDLSIGSAFPVRAGLFLELSKTGKLTDELAGSLRESDFIITRMTDLELLTEALQSEVQPKTYLLSSAENPVNAEGFAGICIDLTQVSASEIPGRLSHMDDSSGNPSSMIIIRFPEDRSALQDLVHNLPQNTAVIFAFPAGPSEFEQMQCMPTHKARILTEEMTRAGKSNPLVWLFQESEDVLYNASVYGGGMLLDGIGDGVLIQKNETGFSLAVDLLQTTRHRIVRTEFISCPSCGRTLFNLQETTARIKSKTGHLKGVRIAVMGCIVNGPGEMADADFGYVGSMPGKINLYRGKEVVRKNISSEEADQALIDLIKEYNMWTDPV